MYLVIPYRKDPRVQPYNLGITTWTNVPDKKKVTNSRCYTFNINKTWYNVTSEKWYYYWSSVLLIMLILLYCFDRITSRKGTFCIHDMFTFYYGINFLHLYEYVTFVCCQVCGHTTPRKGMNHNIRYASLVVW